MKARGLKPVDLAGLVKRSTFYRWASGVTHPSALAVQALAHRLGVSERWLAEGVGEMFTDESEQNFARYESEGLSVREDGGPDRRQHPSNLSVLLSVLKPGEVDQLLLWLLETGNQGDPVATGVAEEVMRHRIYQNSPPKPSSDDDT